MSVLGIVAEYNPFHNGHQYLIEEAIARIQPYAVICVMSGSFTQRGEPAVCNKWSRTEMALKGGVDVVIELPFSFAVRSAYYFARGAVLTLFKTGVATHLAFGSESGDIESLKCIARILSDEPAEYKGLLKKHLGLGHSFPAARSHALQDLLRVNDKRIKSLLSGPNNILALEYLHVIQEENLPLVPVTITRRGSEYHSPALETYSSAGAIRQALLNQTPLSLISQSMPPSSWDVLVRELEEGRAPVDPDALEKLVLFTLRRMTRTEIQSIYEVSEGLENRIKEAANICATLDRIRCHVKTKRYSLTRINRILLYSIFQLSKTQIKRFDQTGPAYLHILGFSAKGQKILQEIKNKSSLPVLNRGADISNILKTPGPAADMLGLDIQASDVFSLLYPDYRSYRARSDFSTPPVRIDD